MIIFLLIELSGYLPHFHTIKHIELHSVDFGLPALMEMTIEPIPQGVVMPLESPVNIIDGLPFLLEVVEQGGILHKPALNAFTRQLLAERRCCMSDDGIDSMLCRFCFFS